MRKRKNKKDNKQIELTFEVIESERPIKSLPKKSSKSKIKEKTDSFQKLQGVFFDNLIKVEELAVIFGLAPQTIRNWVALGKIPYVKIGRRNLFLKRSVQEWLNQKEKPQWQ